MFAQFYHCTGLHLNTSVGKLSLLSERDTLAYQKPSTSLVALTCTFSNISMCFCKWGSQAHRVLKMRTYESSEQFHEGFCVKETKASAYQSNNGVCSFPLFLKCALRTTMRSQRLHPGPFLERRTQSHNQRQCTCEHTLCHRTFLRLTRDFFFLMHFFSGTKHPREDNHNLYYWAEMTGLHTQTCNI